MLLAVPGLCLARKTALSAGDARHNDERAPEEQARENAMLLVAV